MKSAPRQSIADDPSFLNSLDDLDGGLPRSVNDLRRTQTSASPRSSPVAAVVTAPPSEALTYEDFYELSEKPFGQLADPRFFYHSASHDEVAQQLLTAIRRREGIVILTGDVGTGKTTLCRAVVEQLDRRTLTSLVLDPHASTEELLKAVLVDFGVISHDEQAGGRATRRELSAALRQFLTSLAPLQAFAVIIVDSAHNLEVEVLQHLRMLSDVVSHDRLLQVVLVGEPALVEHVGRPELQQLAQRVTVQCRLGPLVEHEIGDYLSYRLGVAGCTSRMPFDDKAQARLHELSGGNPRTINLLCDRALTLGWTARSTVIDGDLVDRAAGELPILPPASAFETQLLAHATPAPESNSSNASGAATLSSRFRSRLRGWLS